MFRHLLLWTASILLLAGLAPPVCAQDAPKQGGGKERPSETLMATFAGIAAIVVLVVVCKPSRR